MPTSVKHLTKPASEHVISLLARWTDGLYYLAEVLECDEEARRCLVKFEDETEKWMGADELHAELKAECVSPENVVCCVCDGEISKAPNEIIICDVCQQGYHVECHRPTIDREGCRLDDDDVDWNCATCKDVLNPKSQTSSPKSVTSSQLTTPKRKHPTQNGRSKSTTKKSRQSTAKKSQTTTPKIRLSQKKKTPTPEVDIENNVPEETINDNNNGTCEPTPVEKIEITPELALVKSELIAEEEIKQKSSPSSPLEEGLPILQEGGGVLEEMEHEVLNKAEILANEETDLDTTDFIKLIADDPPARIVKDSTKSSKVLKPVKQVAKKETKSKIARKPKAAAQPF